MIRIGCGILIGLVLGGASAALGGVYGEDPFVRMIERHLSGAAHVEIGPGVTIVTPECGCTIKYLGTRVDGRHYHVDIDKLD